MARKTATVTRKAMNTEPILWISLAILVIFIVLMLMRPAARAANEWAAKQDKDQDLEDRQRREARRRRMRLRAQRKQELAEQRRLDAVLDAEGFDSDNSDDWKED